ncbi:MAG: hypothetical protein JW757_06445 [Anaerolineales bacterium]|nr:hypothetical protein [Anaerolineales bacterium]
MKHKSLWDFAAIVILLCLVACQTQSPERAAELTFKGMELYSWQAESGEWQFSLLPGTNRIKTFAEVAADPLDQHELEADLSKLAVGETVFWVNRVEGDVSGQMVFPPQVVIEAIVRHANGVDVTVEILHP